MPEDKEDIQEEDHESETPKDTPLDKVELLKQIKVEFKISENYKGTYRKKWIRQMKMMNNEKIDNEKIGDETMYSTFNTVQSSLDSDEMMHEFDPTDRGDDETCELLNNVATHHYNKVRGDEVNREWTYWSLFAGRAVVDQSEFHHKILSCVPKVINPFLEYVDPRATSMHGTGITGERSARWYGYELQTTVGAMKDVGITVEKKSNNNSEAVSDMNQAQNITYTKAYGDNEDVNIYVWYTRFNGKKYKCLVDCSFKKLYKATEVGERYPLADRSTNIAPITWYPRSIPDLLEDKHRGRANILNTSMEMIREQLKPIYVMKDGTMDPRALESAESGDILEASNIDDIRPLQKASITQDVDWILNILDRASQEVSATPDIQQGVMMDEQRTASELNLVASGSKNRYGMTVRVFGGSHRLYLENWYTSIQENFNDDVHSMMVKISGVYGPSWRVVKKRDMTLTGDLDIKIRSKVLNDQKNATERAEFIEFHTLASSDPTYDIREGIRMIGKKSAINTQEMNLLLRKTTDELEAEEENKILIQNKLEDGEKGAIFNIRQNHDAHIREHMKLDMSIPAVKAHIETHYEAKIYGKNNPDIMSFIGQNFSEGDQAHENTKDQNTVKTANRNPLGLPTF